ncbi:hypothetical protein [Pseudokineococcus sp. 1T1Z-3]|uniref:hypothetical protein n=1 Tax=Pseudokineococcus sp. 1T1Z-3 TaxID=3132745 RepID=UPI0030A6FD85
MKLPGRHARPKVDLRQLRRRVEGRIAALDIPEPFNIDVLCDRIAQRQGRPIDLRPMHEDDPTVPCGMWLQMPSRDVILFEASASTPHRDLIVAHELGHLLANHPCDPRLLEAYRARAMPDLALNPDLLTRVLGRVSYTTPAEQEAELFAWLLLNRSRGDVDESHATQDLDDPVARAIALLGPSL